MAELHEALECLRPKEFSDVPTNNLENFLPEILSKAEIIANSIPPPPNGTPYESAQRTRTSSQPASNAADLTKSEVRRPPPAKEHHVLQKSWGKPLKLGAKETATGMSVYKMAGHDRHGAWFARSSVHEGLGFTKWKHMMQREFPESLAVQGGPGEGNIRGIGGDQVLEDMTVDGIGNLQVYQLSAQFAGPTSPREFITLLITSENALSDASKIGSTIPRHWMVVSIPVSHPRAPPRNGMVRGFYESIEMIREIPMKGNEDAETNPVEWIMVTRSDPGGGIPRFMVERNVPSSIVADAVKFLDWACAKNDTDSVKAPGVGQDGANDDPLQSHDAGARCSMENSNGIGAGIGTSIADNPSATHLRTSHQTVEKDEPVQESYLDQLKDTVGALGAYIPDAVNPMPQLERTISSSSSSTTSSVDSFASAEQFTRAPEGLPIDDSIPTPSTASEVSVTVEDSHHARELNRIEVKRAQLREKLEADRERRNAAVVNESQRSQKEIEKAAEKHAREKKKQEEKYAKEIRKLEERREKETKKLLLRQQKEADKSKLVSTQKERDEFKREKELLEEENKLLKEQVQGLQRENTALVARLGKSDVGREILAAVREAGEVRTRASSRASGSSGKSGLAKSGLVRGELVRSDTSASTT